MGFFKDLKADFSAAINDLVPGGDSSFDYEEIPDDSQTLSQDIDTEAEFSKLDGLLEKVEHKAKGNDDSAIFKPIEDFEPITQEPVVEEKTSVIEEVAIEEEPIIEEPVIEEAINEEPVIEEAEEIEATDSIDLAPISDDWSDIKEESLAEEDSDAVEEPVPTWSDTKEDEIKEDVPSIEEEPIIDEEPIIEEEEAPIEEDSLIEEEPVALDTSDNNEATLEEVPDDYAFTFEEVTNNNSYKEDNKMDEFTSITPEVTESAAEITEPEISLEISDEISVITEGTKIKGNMETSGSFEIRGHVEGDLKCNGKLTVTGTVLGASSSSEFFADASHIEGEIVSSGTVKIGLGSVIMGNITATSAVIAGAVKGDIDVQGPVVVDSSAVILGNIKSRSVVINNGAVIEGFCSQCYSDVDVEGLFGKNK